MKHVFSALSLFAAAVTLAAAEGKPVSLFDGKTFSGWDGDTNKTWRIENGTIMAGSLTSGKKVPRNEFLATTRNYTNFVLKLQFKLTGTNGFVNSGVQVRSERVPNDAEMKGYQVDLGDPEWWGSVYDESRRNKVMAKSDMKAVNAVLKRGEWNEYLIRCEGKRIRAWINGAAAVDYTEAEPEDKIPQFGKIGLQIHGGGVTEVSFKSITMEELP